MMIKISYVQMDVIPNNPELNFIKMKNFIEKAKLEKSDVIIFSELCLSGYLLGDIWEQSAFLKELAYLGEKIKDLSEDIVIIFGNIALDYTKKNTDGRIRKYNSVFVCQNKRFLTPKNSTRNFMVKTLLPNYREFDDSRYFYSNLALAQEENLSPHELIKPFKISIGNEELNLGIMLCEDGWSEDYGISPMDILVKKHNIDLLINISASPYTFGKKGKRDKLFSKCAKQYRKPIIYINNVGIQNNGKSIYTFDGSSSIYSKEGKIVDRISEFEEAIHTVEYEADDFHYTYELEKKAKEDIGDIYKAIIYGGKKFLSNINMDKVVIGISGGIDSAVAAAIYSKILGPENVILINMPSKFNSETTKNLAYKLGENLGTIYATMSIENSLENTVAQISETKFVNLKTKEELYIAPSDFVKENIQARDRSTRILASVAATLNIGFTCNANKTETAVGYSTLYGDGAGFLAILADLWKFQIYEMANYLNKEIYKKEVIPQGIIDIVPSAELSSEQNVDEGKGDPIKYPYHDYLFRIFLESWQKITPEDILQWYQDGVLEEKLGCQKGIVSKYFKDDAEFIADLERWWNLFAGFSIAKRIQSPPILAISRRAFGFDYRESQNKPYYTIKYREMKKALLEKK